MRIAAKMPFFPIAYKSFILHKGPGIFKYAILSDRPIQNSRLEIQDALLYKNPIMAFILYGTLLKL